MRTHARTRASATAKTPVDANTQHRHDHAPKQDANYAVVSDNLTPAGDAQDRLQIVK